MPVEHNDFQRFADLTEDAQQQALTRIGIKCMQVSMPNCPVDTGNLRRSHKYAIGGDHVDVGVTAEYGGYVHNGTVRQRANPWLKNAVQANRDSILESGINAYAVEINGGMTNG